MKTTTKAIFTLKKQAKSSGGDRYTGILNEEPIDIYFPQSITRPENASAPVPELTVTVES